MLSPLHVPTLHVDDNDAKTQCKSTMWLQIFVQDGRRVVRPQSVADMEELGRNLENMQIVNSRFGKSS